MSKHLSEEQEALAWMESVIAEGSIFKGSDSIEVVGGILRDGVYLCKLMIKLQPDLCTKVRKPANDLQRKENIEAFLDDCHLYGIPMENVFKINDLYEESNINEVMKTIIAIKKKYQAHTDGHDEPRGRDDTPHPFAKKKTFDYPDPVSDM